MNNLKHIFKASLLSAITLVAVSCSNNDDDPQPNDTDKVYALGLGVTTTEATTNYVLSTGDLMSGTLSLVNQGLLQVGYRDYLAVGSTFYSIGGLGVTDVNAVSLDASNNLTTKTGLTFENAASDIKDVDGTGKTLLSVFVPGGPTAGTNQQFTLVDVATNAITKK